jgi:ribosomal-protein-alanine N-acetyltransferase
MGQLSHKRSSILADTELQTVRLRLLALSLDQLRSCLDTPERLEQELGIPLSLDVVTEPVRRAIGIMIEKMSRVTVELHPWHTYWLLVIAAQRCGVGLAGFKGEPDKQGEVEISYGIVPAQRSQGYITEAVQALIAWALRDPACRSVVADTTIDNVASNRVLAKVGMHVFRETADALFWRIEEAASDASRSDSGRQT